MTAVSRTLTDRKAVPEASIGLLARAAGARDGRA